MARKPSSRLLLNRSRLDKVPLAFVDGLAEVGRTILDIADPPDATPFGEGLVTRGGYLVYADGKKVDGYGQDGKQPKPPRSARVSRRRGVTLLVGWGFPGRFQEHGTVHHRAQPFATPAVNRVIPRAVAIMRPLVEPKLRALR